MLLIENETPADAVTSNELADVALISAAVNDGSSTLTVRELLVTDPLFALITKVPTELGINSNWVPLWVNDFTLLTNHSKTTGCEVVPTTAAFIFIREVNPINWINELSVLKVMLDTDPTLVVCDELVPVDVELVLDDWTLQDDIPMVRTNIKIRYLKFFNILTPQ